MSIQQQQLLWPAEPIDPAPPFHPTIATSREAAERIRPVAGIGRDAVYDVLFASGEHGLTDAEIREKTGLASDTARPRRGELVKAGFVRNSGRSRLSPSGRAMHVWVVTSLLYRRATDA